MLRGKK